MSLETHCPPSLLRTQRYLQGGCESCQSLVAPRDWLLEGRVQLSQDFVFLPKGPYCGGGSGAVVVGQGL